MNYFEFICHVKKNFRNGVKITDLFISQIPCSIERKKKIHLKKVSEYVHCTYAKAILLYKLLIIGTNVFKNMI